MSDGAIEPFPPEIAAGIVEHMNDDHADAVVAIARAHGGVVGASGARLVDITPRALVIETVGADGERRVSVPIDPPVDPLDTVRARLVAMTRAAREALASR